MIHKYRHGSEGKARCHEIRSSVSVQVSEREGDGGVPRRVIGSRRERAVPIAQEKGNIAGALVRHKEIGPSVSAQITHGDGDRPRGGYIVHVRLERTVPIAQEDGNGFRVRGDRYEIGLPISIHISDRDRETSAS